MEKAYSEGATITISSPNVEKIIELSKEVDSHNRKIRDLIEEMRHLGLRIAVDAKEIAADGDVGN